MKLIIACSIAVVIFILSLMTTQTSIQVSDAAGASPTPGSTISVEEERDIFRRELTKLEIDFGCEPICWNSFIPGQTEVREVYLWVYENLSDDEYVTVPYLPEFDAIHNFVLYNSEIMLVAFPDSTQPEPFLRGYSLSFSAQELANSSLATAFSQDLVENWLPNAVTKHFEMPSSVIIGESYLGRLDNYFMMLNFEEENFSVLYQYDPAETDVTSGGFCAQNIIENISILVYSDDETDVNSLLSDLEGYFEIDWLPHVFAYRRFDTTLYSQEEDVDGFVEQISGEGCISE